MNKIKPRKIWIIYGIVFAAFVCMGVFAGLHHEPWADEAQSWLIARDNNNLIDLLKAVKYEGTLPTWHLINKAFQLAGLDYDHMFVIPLVFSAIGVILLFFTDAPLWSKIMLPFSFFVVYQNSVVARQYAMVFPAMMLIVIFYRKRFDVPVRIFRYPSGYNPPSNEINLKEPNLTIPPDGYTYDVTVTLDLTNYDFDDPGNVYGYVEYTLTAQRKYVIKSESDWNTFCSRLGDNDTYNRFSGETVYLDNDITVSQQAGYSQHDFCGTFDGQGHTLTFNYNGNGSDDFVAPFHYVSNTKPEGSTEDDPDSPVTIKNLNVVSTIRGSGNTLPD